LKSRSRICASVQSVTVPLKSVVRVGLHSELPSIRLGISDDSPERFPTIPAPPLTEYPWVSTSRFIT